jgi:uncharacterized protein YjbI with pentapeptide repeats/beta-lactamase regulating signal transducer with metallopeptidase domain
VIEWPQGFVNFATALSATALNALWQDALLVLCVWLVLRAWPRINAATRYAVWSATLIGAIVIPVATTLAFFTLPKVAHAPSLQAPAQATNSSARAPAAPSRHHLRVYKTSPVLPAQETLRRPERLQVTLPAWLAIAIFAAWLLLAAYALVRLAIGLVRLEQLKRDALPLAVEYRDEMPQWLRANKGARDVRLCVSDETDVPVAVGLFDAMILIPHSLLDQLSQPEVDQICLHELAHLRRADDWTNGLQRVITALLGWNPAAQFIGQQLDLEREVACDDWVLSFVGTVRPYALCLTKMAEHASWPRHPIPAPGVFATRKHISLRIERLLGAGRNVATNLALAPAAAAVAVVGALALVIAVVAPSVAAPCVGVSQVQPAKAVSGSTTASAAKPASSPITREIVRIVHVPVPVTPAPLASAAVRAPEPRLPALPKNVEMPATSLKIPKTSVTIPKMKLAVPMSAGEAEAEGDAMAAAGEAAGAAAASAAMQASAKHLADQITTQVSGKWSKAAGSRVAQSGQNCSGCDYARVDWSGRDMHGVNFTGVDLSGSKLIGTNFAGGNFNGVDFSRSNLHNASFRNAHLIGCDFSGADLTGADFTGARINGCQFTHAQLTSTQLRDVLNSCTGCDFTRANLSGLDLSNIHANGDDFTHADLRGVNFSGAQLTGIDFTRARLDGANFAGATLNGSDLSGVDLTHVDLSRAKLIGTDLSNQRPPR